VKILTALAVILASAGAAAFLYADQITCTDGKVFTGVIRKQTADRVTIEIIGAEVEIPHAEIKSIEASPPGSDSALTQEWGNLNARYKEEDEAEEARERAQPEPTATPFPTPEPEVSDDTPAEEDTSDEVTLPSAEAPEAPTAEEERLDWEGEVHKDIHEKRVEEGMTKRQVRDALGWPDLTHPVHGVGAYTDRWIYQQQDVGRTVVFFKNGLVVGVEQE